MIKSGVRSSQIEYRTQLNVDTPHAIRNTDTKLISNYLI